ncbi:MAG: hypothetical protein WCI04_00620, partial [archaeon]
GFLLIVALILGLPILIGIGLVIKLFVEGHKRYIGMGNQISFARYLFMTLGDICYFLTTAFTALYAQSFLLATPYLLSGTGYFFPQSHLIDGFLALISVAVNWKVYKYFFQFKIGKRWVNPQSSFPAITDSNRLFALIFVAFSFINYLLPQILLAIQQIILA